jgi:hypothetical protein
MLIDQDFRPAPGEVGDFLTWFGENIYHRYHRLKDFPAQRNDLVWAIRNDLQFAGIPGLISLIRVLITEDRFDHRKLCLLGKKICGEIMGRLFREVLALFEGRKPGRHLWHRDEDGAFHLNAFH